MRPRPRETKLASKKNRILNEIFRERQRSRFELAKRLNINASMVGRYVDEFLERGLLEESLPSRTGRGRAPRPLRLNAGYGDFLGLDFEALRARAVLTNFAGEVRWQEEVPFRSDIARRQVLRRIVNLARRLASRSARLLAVGIAAPGQVDCVNGRILRYELLDDFCEVPIREAFQAHFEVPIIVEDNIRALTYAEMLRGNGRGHRNLLCLAVRSGVGLGIVIDGRLYAGAGSMAGEVGYNVFPQRDRMQRVTDVVSATGIVRQVIRSLKRARKTKSRQALLCKGGNLSLSEVVEAAEGGDKLLAGLLEQVGTTLGVVVANLANLFSPEKILLTGEVPQCCHAVRQAVERTFRRHALPQVLQTTALDSGILGGFAAAEGAAFLGFAAVFPESEAAVIQAESAKNAATPAG